MYSGRTKKYTEALIREGDKFNYAKWLRQTKEEETRAKRELATAGSGEAVARMEEAQPSTEAPILLNKSVPVVESGMPLRVDRLVTVPDRKSLGQRLGKVADAWERFQDDRGRDAVYGYMRAVFALVKRYGGRRRTKRLVRRAFKFAGLPVDKHADPFTAVIRCTSDGKPDDKTISKWARALRYVARVKKPSQRVTAFMKSSGGVNACAGLYTQKFGRGKGR
jgi:hypothetical protein